MIISTTDDEVKFNDDIIKRVEERGDGSVRIVFSDNGGDMVIPARACPILVKGPSIN